MLFRFDSSPSCTVINENKNVNTINVTSSTVKQWFVTAETEITLHKRILFIKYSGQNKFLCIFFTAELRTTRRRLRWSSGQHAGLWYPSSRVETRPKSLDFSGISKILRMPSVGGEVKESVPCPSFAACKRTQYLRELRCASKIPCIVPSFGSRGLSCLCGAWRLWR